MDFNIKCGPHRHPLSYIGLSQPVDPHGPLAVFLSVTWDVTNQSLAAGMSGFCCFVILSLSRSGPGLSSVGSPFDILHHNLKHVVGSIFVSSATNFLQVLLRISGLFTNLIIFKPIHVTIS
jgi:hypothetical protein